MNPTEQKKPGLACPKCNRFIETTIGDLISKSYIECSHCRLRLNINKQESKKALDILQDVEKARQNLDKASNFKR